MDKVTGYESEKETKMVVTGVNNICGYHNMCGIHNRYNLHIFGSHTFLGLHNMSGLHKERILIIVDTRTPHQLSGVDMCHLLNNEIF